MYKHNVLMPSTCQSVKAGGRALHFTYRLMVKKLQFGSSTVKSGL